MKHAKATSGDLYAMTVKTTIERDGDLYVARCADFPEMLLGSESVNELVEQIPEALCLACRLRLHQEPKVLPSLRPGPVQQVNDTWVLLFDSAPDLG